MAPTALLSVLAQPDVDVDAPGWAPIVFAAGAFAIVVVMLMVVYQKLKQPTARSDEAEDPDSRDQD